ncbi:hypothetical protein FGO68_gene7752 [Halteria grandinella]|uniref:Transmembrane protein n=1 Tax=Halteria grandinella TaxID=5974 RepID=A0A8J8NGY9_HALGN|nr:hypothetical protein FGO68_gene7752 [Halteria grandinella]
MNFLLQAIFQIFQVVLQLQCFNFEKFMELSTPFIQLKYNSVMRFQSPFFSLLIYLLLQQPKCTFILNILFLVLGVRRNSQSMPMVLKLAQNGQLQMIRTDHVIQSTDYQNIQILI